VDGGVLEMLPVEQMDGGKLLRKGGNSIKTTALCGTKKGGWCVVRKGRGVMWLGVGVKSNKPINGHKKRPN